MQASPPPTTSMLRMPAAGAPPDWQTRPLFLFVVEIFTLITAVLFVVSLTMNSFIFAKAGLSFTQVASPSDVLMSGFTLLYRSIVAILCGGAVIFLSRSKLGRCAGIGIGLLLQVLLVLLTQPLDRAFRYETGSYYSYLALAAPVIVVLIIAWSSELRRRAAQLQFDETMLAEGFDPKLFRYTYSYAYEKTHAGEDSAEPELPLRERLNLYDHERAHAAERLVQYAAEHGLRCGLEYELESMGHYGDRPRDEQQLSIDHAHPLLWIAGLVTMCGSFSALLQGGFGYVGATFVLINPPTCAPNVVFWMGEHSTVVLCAANDKVYPLILKDAQDIKVTTNLRYGHPR